MIKRILDILKPDFVIVVNRCNLCRNTITDFQVAKGIYCRCGSNRIVPTNPSLAEKIKIIISYILKGY